jgi:hypothetical protein
MLRLQVFPNPTVLDFVNAELGWMLENVWPKANRQRGGQQKKTVLRRFELRPLIYAFIYKYIPSVQAITLQGPVMAGRVSSLRRLDTLCAAKP